MTRLVAATVNGLCAGPGCQVPVRARGVAFHPARVLCVSCGAHNRWAGWVTALDGHACPACLWQRWTA